MIEFQEVSMQFDDGLVVLDSISVRFDAQSLTFLTGRSGAGKTTFLRLLMGLLKPTNGQVLVEDVNIHQLNPRELLRYRKRLGVVFQEHMLLEYRTIFENLSLPLWIQGKSKPEIREQVRLSLAQLDLLDVADYYPNQLSAGEQQRAAIARSTINEPALLVADEPTGNLDVSLAHQTIDLLRHYNRAGTPVIVATHNQNLILEGERVLNLENGGYVEYMAHYQ